ncbi:TetR/AcrR family transcriptional regulator [Clavibacter phaseoli]|uniref:TetR/AcrR family transcriptional regulator n=1 Tax=Clavibacter phaseoli TaxID=1734031 RepID=UPI001C70F5CE|nr:TetR family transcriptional regulator [Clavibacter phaseoli]
MREGVLNVRGMRRRVEILAAARAVFAEAGYRGATMAAVAARAGVTHAGLLYHFAAKEALLEAVLADEAGRQTELLRVGAADAGASRRGRATADDGREASDASGDALDRLRALVARNEAEPEWARLFSMLLGESVSPDHPVRERMAERYDTVSDALARTLGDLAVALDPDARPSDAELRGLARLLLAVMDGLQYQSLTGSAVDAEREFALMAELVRSRLASGS